MNGFILVAVIAGKSVTMSSPVTLNVCKAMQRFISENRSGAVTICISGHTGELKSAEVLK